MDEYISDGFEYDNECDNDICDEYEYTDEAEVDFNLIEAIGWVGDKLSKWIRKKAIKYALEQIAPPGSTIVLYNNDTKLELMFQPVDNTKMSYEEFCKNQIRKKLNFSIDIEHVLNSDSKIEALIKEAFEL